MCNPVYVSASYICVHVSASSVPALWHLGLLFPTAGSWSIPLELFPQQGWLFCKKPVRHPPLFSLFFSSSFPILPFFRCSPWLGLCCHLASRSRQDGKEHPAPLGKGFSAASWGCATFRKPSSTNIPSQKKENNKRREAQRHCWHLPESWSCLPGKGFYWLLHVLYLYNLSLDNAAGI